MNSVHLIGNLATDVELREVGERKAGGELPPRGRSQLAGRRRRLRLGLGVGPAGRALRGVPREGKPGGRRRAPEEPDVDGGRQAPRRRRGRRPPGGVPDAAKRRDARSGGDPVRGGRHRLARPDLPAVVEAAVLRRECLEQAAGLADERRGERAGPGADDETGGALALLDRRQPPGAVQGSRDRVGARAVAGVEIVRGLARCCRIAAEPREMVEHALVRLRPVADPLDCAHEEARHRVMRSACPIRAALTGRELELREKLADRARHDVGPLADREMPAVGDHAQRRPQAARVLHAVLERHPVVVGPPQAEAGAADAVEVGPRVGRDERAAGRERVGVLGRPGEKRLRHLGIEPDRVRDAPPAEGEPPAERRPRDTAAVPADEAARPDDAHERHRHLADPARRRDPRRRGEDDAADGLGTPHRGAKRDEAAERVPDPGGGEGALGLGHRDDRVGERVERRGAGEAPGAAVTGQLRDDHAPGAGERRGDEPPVRGGAAEPVDEQEGRAFPADEVPEPGPGVLVHALLEAGEISFGLRRHQGIFFR